MIQRHLITPAAIALAVLHLQTSPAISREVVFTVDPARSSISLSGSIAIPGVGTYPFQAQGTGSLTTSYRGSIITDLSPTSLEFPGGSLIEANTNGTWHPSIGGGSGSAPANYGIQITPFLTTGYAAARNLSVDLTSPPTLLTNGSFDASQFLVGFLTNSTPAPSVDFRITSFLFTANTNGTAPLFGSAPNSPGTGYLTNGSGLLTLILPVNTTNTSMVGGNQTTLVLRGQIVATAPADSWPLLVSIKTQAGRVMLEWPSLPGQHFAVETTSDFNMWLPASGTMSANADSTTWAADKSGAARFYRVGLR